MTNLLIILISLTVPASPVRSSEVSGLVNQVINVTLPLTDFLSDGSESLLCQASVPYIKFIDDQSEEDSLLGILLSSF